jgi:hypothetical protein
MSEKIKPCPLCGGDPILLRSRCSFGVICQECNLKMWSWLSGKDEAIEKWNRRTEEMNGRK